MPGAPAMFGIFKSRSTRAAEETVDFIVEMLAPYGKIPTDALRDPYCIGFLQIVGVHVASKFLKSDGKSTLMEKGIAVFEEALKAFAPNQASEVAEQIPFIRSERSPHNEAYLRGVKDGDLFMGYRLLHFAPQQDGEAALERFVDRVRNIDAPTTNQQSVEPA
jgi:hypothetical protein